MKKTNDSLKRHYTRKKTAKKPASSRRRRSKKSSNFIRALQLVGMLAAISIFISLAVIFIHSNFVKWNNTDIVENVLPDSDTQVQDAVSVSISSGQDEGGLAHTLPSAVENDDQLIINTPPQITAAQTAGNTQPAANAAPPVSVNVGPDTATQTVAQSTNVTTQPPSAVNNNPTQTIAVSSQRPIENSGTLVFVIDDAGNNLNELEPFLRIPYPLTIAVLPGLPYSTEAARRIRAAGKEVILHQPMEALGGQNPGPGAIYSGMSAAEIRSVLKRNLDEIGPVAGMNNHQGSMITADKEMMRIILSFCAENGLYFLDSRTTAETVVPAEARGIGVKITERDTFIDNEQDRASMIYYINSGLERAQKNGSAVMIGHTWSPLLAPLLAEQFVLFSRQGYSIKTASDIVK